MGKTNRPKSQKNMLDPKAKIAIYDRQVQDKADVIEQLKKMPIIEIACKRANVSRSSFYRWKAEDKIFSRDADQAMKEGEDFISDMSESQLISMIKDKKFSAVQLWLKTHSPKYASRLEISGQLTTREEEELSPEQQDVVRQALHFAGYKKHGRKQQK